MFVANRGVSIAYLFTLLLGVGCGAPAPATPNLVPGPSAGPALSRETLLGGGPVSMEEAARAAGYPVGRLKESARRDFTEYPLALIPARLNPAPVVYARSPEGLFEKSRIDLEESGVVFIATSLLRTREQEARLLGNARLVREGQPSVYFRMHSAAVSRYSPAPGRVSSNVERNTGFAVFEWGAERLAVEVTAHPLTLTEDEIVTMLTFEIELVNPDANTRADG